jgi:gluconolactonase
VFVPGRVVFVFYLINLKSIAIMKKNLVLFLGVACSFGYYSCQKGIAGHPDPVDAVEAVSRTTNSVNESVIFDPACLVAPRAQLQKLGEGFGFTEGPAVDKNGNIFFTDQPNNKIYKWAANNGRITTFLSNSGRSNGMYFDKNGYLITCADMHGEIWSIDKNGHHTVLVNNYNGKLLNGPNDLWINPVNGGIYVTDPLFPRDYWDDTDPRKGPWPGYTQQGGGYVYYLSPDRKKFTRVENQDLGYPNGIVGSPDGKKLYVGKWPAEIYVYDINRDGRLSNKKLFSTMGGDGMTTDERGNVYVSNELGITAFDERGHKVFNVPTGESWTANVVFGGQNSKTLFITASGGVYGLKMKVKGVVN